MFDSIRNELEQRVFQAVLESADAYPEIAGSPGLLADVACVALNRLPPRYIRHSVDMIFYMTDGDRARQESALTAAVEFAFRFIESRSAQQPEPR
jgi:hypothetical protein